MPRLSLKDLPLKGQTIPTEITSVKNIPLHLHSLFTGGIVYIDIGFDLNTLPLELIPYLSIYCEYITRCGAGKYTYEQMAKRIALETGGIDASVNIKTLIGKDKEILFKLFFHIKSLTSKVEKALEILIDLFCCPDFSNYNLLKDIIFEERNSFNSAIISSGHHFAMSYAAAKLLPARQLEEQIDGVSQLRFLESILNKKEEDNKKRFLGILDKLRAIHEYIINRATMTIILTADSPEKFAGETELVVNSTLLKEIQNKDISLNFIISPSITGIEVNAAVNFIGKVWRLPPYSPEVLGRIMLLSRILSTGYLWDKVRVEGGAYGGMSSVSPSHPLFFCASYRDPNLLSTLEHFINGIKEAGKGLPKEVVEQNIIGTIGLIDAPKPPHVKGLGESINLLIGYTPEFRQNVREAILNATPNTISETANLIINLKEHSLTILANSKALDIAAENGLVFQREKLIV
ncbi:MAG: hypothetical protein N2053_08240 [Chitinispirillaceae bacterium]|nr:hypothetical protein [Chitinispirillaceae bacterium]